MTFIEFLFFLDGRITRRILWRRLLLPLGVASLFALYMEWVFQPANFGLYGVQAQSGGIWIFLLLLAWPIVAVSVKRLHDRGKSGWWMLLAAVPYVGWVWYIVEVGLLDGTWGPNHFGPDPLERQPVE